MALTNWVIGSSGHAGGTWTIQNTNAAQIGRFHDLGFLAEGSTSSLGQARHGMLPGPATGGAGTQVPNCWLAAPSGSGLDITVGHGAAIVERSTRVGPYLVVSEVTATVTLATANATNPRIDRVDLQVLDGALGDNGGDSQSAIIVTTGTAAGSPTVPPAPANSEPICQVLLPANTATLTAGMVTDTRRSAGLRGATRVLLPGDSLSDPGFMSGEMRDTRLFQVSAGGGTIDSWNAAAGVWELVYPLPGLHEVDFASTASIPTNHAHAMGWGTINKSSADVTLGPGGPDVVANGAITFVKGGLWQVNVSIDCPLPSNPANTTAFRVRAPTDTGQIFFGSGSNSITSDGGPIHIFPGTVWSVIVVQQTGSTQTVGSRLRAALLRG